MKFSIIIPYYYKKKELIHTLDAVSRQLFRDFEAVIINDGSDEINQELIDRHYNFPIQYYYYPRTSLSGRSFARNRGIEKAAGDYLLFLDCDQVIDPEFLSNHNMCFEQNPGTPVIQFGTRRYLLDDIEADTSDYGSIPYAEDIRHTVFREYEDILSIRGLWHLVYSHNLSVPRAMAVQYGGFDETFTGWGLEDTEFTYRMMKNGGRIIFNPHIETYSQFEGGRLDEYGRFDDWSKNMALFQNKFPEAPVILQDVFINYFNVERRKLLQKSGIGNVWLFCFRQFERSLEELR